MFQCPQGEEFAYRWDLVKAINRHQSKQREGEEVGEEVREEGGGEAIVKHQP